MRPVWQPIIYKLPILKTFGLAKFGLFIGVYA
jgi:hypothetical protein